MKDKILLTDCDGVLCDWHSGFNKFMAVQGLPQLPDTGDLYSIANRHGITAQQATEFIREYNESPGISHLDSFADSREYVEKFANLGFRFIAVTSISDAVSSKHYRSKNLFNLFGDVFDEINCIEMGASKAHILKRWEGSGYFWIEDHMRQAEAGYEAGLKPILINQPYNAHYKTDLFPIVSYTTPWKEIYDIVCKEYNV